MRLNSSPSLSLVAMALSAFVAAAFGAGVSPSKFELSARPGEILRDTVTIFNPGGEPEDFELKTADWRLTDEGGVEFVEDSLLEDSCRPWVRLERRNVRVGGGAEKNYRFEVHVPDDAADGLCRFAIIVEPTESFRAQVGSGGVSIPMVARYAVITYVTIGEAVADTEYLGLGTQTVGGHRLPTVTFRNRGTTYDRAFGRIVATDSAGQRIPMVPSTFPVLPGRSETLTLVLDMDAESADELTLVYPLSLRGQIEIGGQVFRIEETLD
ncbi:MAG: hypothetical protein GWN29_13055 [Gammaproteobacteria bacterium]|nr:hypothetical protein [Gammaproteobacteria bacterium]